LSLADDFLKPIQWGIASQEAAEHDVLVDAQAGALLTPLVLGAGRSVVLIIRRLSVWQTAGLADEV
jgi:hypothetical protein